MSVDGMNEYDRKAWSELDKWRTKRLNSSQRHLVPRRARERLTHAGHSAKRRIDQLPGAESFQEQFMKALDGLLGIINRGAEASLRRQAIVAAYRKRGHVVDELCDVAKMDLRDVDKVKPRLDLYYTIASTIEGAAAGVAVSGGEIIAAGGGLLAAGAGAAPGAGTVVGVMAADAAAVIAAGTRCVAHTAAYYGYDSELIDERLFALGVLNFGIAHEAGKAAAYIELNKIVQALARRATWKQLDKNGVTQIVKAIYLALGMKITQQKLGQAVPVVGIVIGAGLNARMLARITSDAEHLYRERFLREKYGLAEPAPGGPAESDDDVAGAISIVDIVDAELESELDPMADPN